MYQDAFDTLSRLGLKRDEAKIYLACLRSKGGLFVHEIVTATKIKRSTVDIMLRRLLGKGFLSTFRDGPRRKFVGNAPDNVLFDFQSSLDDFRALIPALMRLGYRDEQTRITFHEGVQGLKKIYDDILLTLKVLPEKERVCRCISEGRHIERLRPRFRQQFINHRVRDCIHVRMIAPHGTPAQTWASSKAELRITKMYDEKRYPFGIEMDLVADKVMFISTRPPVGGVTLQSRMIASSMRAMFDLLWDHLGREEPDADDKVSPPGPGKKRKGNA